MATVNLGAIKFNWKGAYNNSTAYVVDDVVSSSGSSYVCILASQGNAVSNGTYWNIMSSAGTNGTNGTDLSTTLTTRGDIVYKGASALTRLPKGTAGYYLKQGANDPEWGTVSSDYVKLSSAGSGAQTGELIFDNLDVATYSAFQIIINAVPTTDNAYFRGTIRTGGASGVNLTPSDYRSAQGTVSGSSSTSQRYESDVNYWEFIANSGFQNYEGITANITFYPRKATHEPGQGNNFYCLGTRTDSNSSFRSVTSNGMLRMTNSTDNANAIMTGFKLFFNTGNIKQYDYELWGMK